MNSRFTESLRPNRKLNLTTNTMMLLTHLAFILLYLKMKTIYLVFIWKRSLFGFWYRAPKLRMAHVDRAAAGRLGRLFTFEDMMGVPRSAQ